MNRPIIIILGEPNSISSEIFLKSLNYIKKTKLNFIIIGNYSLLEKQAKYLNFKINTNLTLSKINNEILNSFYNQNEIEKDYLKNIIKIDMKWSKLIRQMYESRLNVNLTEVNRELEKKDAEDDEKLKKQLIITEQNKLLNKFSATHLEKSKKKYLIKFL